MTKPLENKKCCCEGCSGRVEDEKSFATNYGCQNESCKCHQGGSERQSPICLCGNRGYTKLMNNEHFLNCPCHATSTREETNYDKASRVIEDAARSFQSFPDTPTREEGSAFDTGGIGWKLEIEKDTPTPSREIEELETVYKITQDIAVIVFQNREKINEVIRRLNTL